MTFAQTMPQVCPDLYPNYTSTMLQLCLNYAQTMVQLWPNYAFCPNYAPQLCPYYCPNYTSTMPPEFCPNYAPNYASTMPQLCFGILPNCLKIHFQIQLKLLTGHVNLPDTPSRTRPTPSARAGSPRLIGPPLSARCGIQIEEGDLK